jgi:hypothetical protein
MDDIQMNEPNDISICDGLGDVDCSSKKGFPLNKH